MPAATPPAELMDRYTLGGTIPITYFYLDNTKFAAKLYKRKEIDQMVADARERKTSYYGATDAWLYYALDKYPITNKLVGVFGSLVPWYESVCLSRGALPLTIEYNAVHYDHPDMRSCLVTDFKRQPEFVDAAFSISSFEHDGLGRYGDPLDPDGDLKAMAFVKSVLKPGGRLYLSVPVGLDTLVWNAHRIYGDKRLPMLLDGWELIEAIGGPIPSKPNDFVQPIYVLKNVQ